MEIFNKLLKHRWVQVGSGLMIASGLVVVWAAWKMGADLASLKNAWKVSEVYMIENPWVLFLAMVLLPGLPFPMSLLQLTTGVVWRDRPVMGCMVFLIALILNQTWTYWVAAKPARKLVEKLLVATSLKIPELPRGDHLKLILVLRLTPGIPLFLQNYLLGFLRAPFHLYLPISILCTGVLGCGVILSGAGLADGNLKWAVIGILTIVIGSALAQAIRSWLEKKKSKVAG
jgi:uncharacterized membrane protein YdjX (TVP38/TMEM64 family)